MERSRAPTVLLVLGAIGGAVLAFPLGLYFGQPSNSSKPARPPSGLASSRKMYSPVILSDPYFIDQQRRNVQSLEANCRQSGTYCDIARAARRRLMELENGR